MSITLTVSFHGGSSKNAVNNLLSYQQGGSGTPILNPAGVTLDELRDFTLGPNGDLYVVAANKDNSNVLQFTPSVPPGGEYTNGTAFVSPASDLSHPFALVFAGTSLFVSNQDDNKVRQFSASTGDHSHDFADGFTTLRGLAADGTFLYVADETGGKNQKGEVSWYALPTGATKASKVGHVDVEDCVHLMYDGSRYLYIGSEKTSEIYLLDTQNLANAPTQLVLPPLITPLKPIQPPDISGMAIACGNLYVASRKGLFVAQYPLSSTTPPTVSGAATLFVTNLPDEPEFVAALNVAGAVSG